MLESNVGCRAMWSGIITDMQGKYTPLQIRTMNCILCECKMFQKEWALEEVTNHRIQQQWPSLKQVQGLTERMKFYNLPLIEWVEIIWRSCERLRSNLP